MKPEECERVGVLGLGALVDIIPGKNRCLLPPDRKPTAEPSLESQ